MKSIIFTHNIDKIIAGDKTQTRRCNGLEVVNQNPDEWEFNDFDTINGKLHAAFGNTYRLHVEFCKPQFKAGDLVYVKEKCLIWRDPDGRLIDNGEGPVYTTDDDYEGCLKDKTSLNRKNSNWSIVSPRYMPQWASRLTLRILEVKAPERVKLISEADALVEGGWTYNKRPIHKAPEQSFFQLWDSIAKRGLGSDKNPWVWPYVFEVVK